jgi:hypothetical protein
MPFGTPKEKIREDLPHTIRFSSRNSGRLNTVDSQLRKYPSRREEVSLSPNDRLFWTAMRRQADFFCGKLNGITFPYSSGRVHFVAFFLKLIDTKNSMIVAINHPTLVKTRLRQKSSYFDKSLHLPFAVMHIEDIGF